MLDNGCECKYCVMDRQKTHRDHIADCIALAWPLIDGTWKVACPSCSHPGQCERCWYVMLDAERKHAKTLATDEGEK